MNFKSLEEVFDEFTNKRVLILGDVMVDSYIYGSVSRISPEAPVPIINVTSRDKRLGGAANVALNIQSLGAKPTLCSIIGDDPGADDFISLLKKRGMSTNGIIKSSKRKTTVKNRVISNGHHLVRIDEEMDLYLNDLDRKSLISHIDQLLSEADLVIFEDYDKGCLDEEVIRHVIQKCRDLSIITAVDPKKRNFMSYQSASLFKPNLKELKEGLNIDVDPTDIISITSAVDKLKSKLNFDSAIITLSEHGVYYQDDKKNGKLDAHLRSISDVSGAGDTVISIAGLCLACGLPIKFVAEISNLGGGIVCEYPGVVPISLKRLKEEAFKNEFLIDFLND